MQTHALGSRTFAPRHAPGSSSTVVGSTARRLPTALAAVDVGSSSAVDYPDPEAKFRRYGAHFGGGFKLGADWLEDAPRVRVRKSADRQRDSLLELAALNDRLAGTQAHEARRKLEYLKMRRHNWEGIFHHITKTDAVATLAVIEDASRKVDEALSEEARERSSVTDLKQQLEALRQEVDAAHQKLHLTQARVEHNLGRVEELRAEAVGLERTRSLDTSSAGARSALLASTSYSVAGAATAAPAAAPTASRPAAAAAPSAAAPPAPRPKAARGSKAAPDSARKRGLQSSLEIEDALRQYWYPAEFSSQLGKDTLIPFDMFGQPWVLFRGADGQPGCLRDECAHRACPLSVGKVVDGQVQCAYHGWQFNKEGSCTKMPSTSFCRGVSVSSLPCSERDGFVWVWPGNGEPPAQVPDFSPPPSGYAIHAEISVDVPVEHGLLMENLLDLAHAPFTHTSTFARGWPVPDFVKFHASRLMAGNWDPYPIGMSFQPPCMVLSTIGLAQPGKIERGVTAESCAKHLHQLHVCLPSKPGHTRLLYRMSLDFMGWVRHVPFIQEVWKQVAAQVLGEDMVLVKGQQARLAAGGDTWAHPVSYDKLAVRYRRWRNSVSTGDLAGAAEQAALGTDVSAGELFGSPADGEECALEECSTGVEV